MSTSREHAPLLMIPGPIELSPAVIEAAAAPPPSHVAPDFIETFGRCLHHMMAVFKAPHGSQPFVLAGSGTLAMEAAVCNLLQPGQRAVVVDTGYFGDRMAQMGARRGVEVVRVAVEPGRVVTPEALDVALQANDVAAVIITHVDTSTGVRTDASALAAVARKHGAMVVVDGVCSAAAEALDMEAHGIDVLLTASQKAIGAPPGLALWVASPRALDARRKMTAPPPMFLDFEKWMPIHHAYSEGRPSYFATPATSLVNALDVALQELVDDEEGELRGIDAGFARHARVGAALRAAWEALGLELLPVSGDIAANTLSAIRYPDGVDASLPKRVAARGVSVAGGLHPDLKTQYFRVGHMGYTTRRGDWLLRTVNAVGDALDEAGHACDVDAAVAALEAGLG